MSGSSTDIKGAPYSTEPLPREENVGSKRFADFDLLGKTFLVTGGARGLGLALAEALVEAGGTGEFQACQLANTTYLRYKMLMETSALSRPFRKTG